MLTLDDVGRHWQLRPAAVRQRIASGELRAVRIAGRYRTNWPSVWACERGRCPEPSEAERYKIPLWTKGDLAALMGVSTRTVDAGLRRGSRRARSARTGVFTQAKLPTGCESGSA
jgi:hypothetical protein